MKKYNNNDFNIKNVGENVELYGWASKVRNLGGLIFIDLRDRSGKVQLVINPDNNCYEEASKVRNEYVLKVNGIIEERQSKNPNMATGEIEVNVSSLEILNEAATPVFELDKDDALEDTRLKYRYLDLRRDNIKNNLITRHKITMAARKFLSDNGFIEVETPILSKSTPEGARDYLVPSRVNKGSFYALPQSPQIYKQLLMIGGVEKYFQIARCFRDEDLRADRQPEFTQIDMEMSFVNEEDVMDNTEKLFQTIFKEVKGYDIKLPLMRMKYDDAINFYGSDKPDLRFDMKINDVTDVFSKCDFELFKRELENKGIINAIVVKNAADKYSRKDIDKLTDFVKTYKSNGLFFLKYNNNEFAGSIVKILTDEVKEELIKNLCLEENDLIFVIAGKKLITKTSLGALRCKLARDLDLIKKGDYKFLWVTDFPSFEWSEEENRFVACHHPFTAPKDEDIDKLLTDKEHCYSKAYDIVCNGYEAGGGSIRIHNADVQEKMFEALELTKEDIEEKFGFFVNAFKYGTPPHGGLAIGLERLTMLLCETDNIKDVIAFPKTSSASCLMSEAPNTVSEKQLEELNIMVK
ncbi:aspartate--tRNA ligase [Clostridium sp. CAG:433]|jgi:aspartyl-tRNA synthetase|nr:aspartate--tRNA ligase [Clostridium sp. CAG:433]